MVTARGDVLDEAVGLLRQALRGASGDDRMRQTYRVNLGRVLQEVARSREDVAAGDEAVELLREALDREDRYSMIGLAEQAARSRDAQGLAEAAALHAEVAEGLPPGHPKRALTLSNLGNAEASLFELTGTPETLDWALRAHRQAVRTTPPGHPARALRMTALGNLLSTRYIHAGNDHDLQEAREAHLEAVRVTGPADPHRSIRLSNLGVVFLRSHLLTGDRALLDDAISTLGEAVEHAGAHPNLPAFRTNFANALRRRFELGGAPTDAEAAAAHGRLAADALGQDHPDYAACQFNLGAVHRAIFRRTGATGDARDAATAFLAGAATPASPALTRATAAINAGRIAAEAGYGDQADAGFGTAVSLLARLAWPGLPRDDQEDLLRRFAHLAPDAAAWARGRSSAATPNAP